MARSSAPTSKPGIKEVAERAGVAISSVSRVLSGHPDVSPSMRDAVNNAVRELGYRPNALARGLRQQRSMSVGFAVANIANPIFADIVRGAERVLREAGYSLLLTNSDGLPELDADNITLLEDRQVDGLLLSLTLEDHPDVVKTLRASKLPMVLLDRDVPAGVAAMSAYFDHRIGMRAAVEHLLELGHRDFALVVGGPALPARFRRAAVEETLWARGGRCLVIEGGFGVEGGYRGALEVLDRSPRPTALIAAGNTLMEGALRALHDRGVEIGRDISFVGCDNVAIAELHQPQIAVTFRDASSLGEVGARVLLEALADRDPERIPPEPTVLSTGFLARPSCAPPPTR
ncbi:MAG: LacI family DNA-binding transcriptional regulator [Actinobacteria bacterium]|nr:LacI family DNA-binding transcriptional regulator [Actinomycetota bacterium]